MILSANYNNEVLHVGDEVIITKDKTKAYVVCIELDKKDKVKNVYALNRYLNNLYDLSKNDFSLTGNNEGTVTKMAEKISGIDY